MTNDIHTMAPARSISVLPGKFTIRVLSDTHQDGAGFRKDLFNRFVKIQKADKASVWIHCGDLCDSDRPSTRHMKKIMYADRTEAWSQEDLRNLQWLDKSIIPQYAPIADSCLGIIDGDHYMVFNNGMTSGQYIAKKLKIPYLGERESFFNLRFHWKNRPEESFQYVIHARHGKGAAPTHGGDVNGLIRQEANYMACLHIGGHSHKENCHPERVKYVSYKGKIHDKIVWYMRGGSLLDGFPADGTKTYAYRKEYSPLPCGWGEMELTMSRNPAVDDPHRTTRKIHIESSKGCIVAA